MNKISGRGQFRSDGTQKLTQSTMTVDAVSRLSGDEQASRTISIAIHEKLPLMNGLSGCESEIQITPDQASRFARLILDLVGQEAPASRPYEIKEHSTTP